MRRGTEPALSSFPSTRSRWASRTPPVHRHLRRPLVCSSIVARTLGTTTARDRRLALHDSVDPPGRNSASSVEITFQVERDAPELVAIARAGALRSPSRSFVREGDLGGVREEEGGAHAASGEVIAALRRIPIRNAFYALPRTSKRRRGGAAS
ncbi:hypothetical protein MTO96_026486 [Rhipicephalus appendiculatus]